MDGLERSDGLEVSLLVKLYVEQSQESESGGLPVDRLAYSNEIARMSQQMTVKFGDSWNEKRVYYQLLYLRKIGHLPTLFRAKRVKKVNEPSLEAA